MSTGSIPSVSQLLSQPNAADQLPGTQQSSSSDELTPSDFLTLLTTEMENQDPTQPQDPTESVTQLAQFSSLQSQEQLTSAFAAFQSNFAVLQASSLVGKSVTVENTDSEGNTSTSTGTISSIDVQDGQPYFTMTDSSGNVMTDSSGNPLLYSLSQIVGIGSSSGTTGTGSTGNTGTGSTGSGG